jgi:hypothetical protein
MDGPTHQARFPGLAEVERIAALDDPVFRNLRITQSYHELSAALAVRVGACANWCTFATWASRQAGQTIRREDLARTLEGALAAAPEVAQAVQRVVASARAAGAHRDAEAIRLKVWEALGPSSPVNRTADAIARGNLKVFAEIARAFARFLSDFRADETFDQEKLHRFTESFRPGDPPDGQEYLRRAFTRYYQAFFEPDAKARAELLLLANVEIGFHEQTRLQPEISDALDALVPDPAEFKRRLADDLFPARGWPARTFAAVKRLLGRPEPPHAEADALVAAARRRGRGVVTEHLMSFRLPDGRLLRLGSDLDVEFPPSLREITNRDLHELLARLDPTPDSVRDTGAADWADLPERLHYIIDLFRCYQESPDLLGPPFTPEQVNELTAGRLPAGRL